ncbi:MAG: signal peptidase I [candidate division Zixibacteria bacterium]|nr:signal peptidase I [candidate division Zixibacteria bacterium]
MKSWIIQIIVMVLAITVLKTSIVAAYHVPSSSMENTLLIGDFIVANQFLYGARVPGTNYRLPAVRDPRAGDIVVFNYPGDGKTRYVKRCVAVGGDTVQVVNKQLYVNGRQVFDAPGAKYIDTTGDGTRVIRARPDGRGDSRDNYGPYIVPPDMYFMMGDNRDNSYDSRYWGPVKRDLILGHAMIIHLSWDDEAAPAPEVSLDDPLSVPRLFLHNGIHFFEKVRWNRLLTLLS